MDAWFGGKPAGVEDRADSARGIPAEMTIAAAPGTGGLLARHGQAFSVLVTALDTRGMMGRFHQKRQRDRVLAVTPVKLLLPSLADSGTLPDQLDQRTGPVPCGLMHALREEPIGEGRNAHPHVVLTSA
jgi:hypothetical protein